MSLSAIMNVIATQGFNISSLIFLIIAIIYLTSRITKWTSTVDGYDERIKKIEDIRDIVTELKTKIDFMFNKARPFEEDPLVGSKSPISLSDMGEEVAKEISAESMFQRYKDKWSDSVDRKNPKNAYDIQQSSFDVVRTELFDSLMDDDLAKLKDIAFKRGVLVENFMSIFGVYLRDYILEKRGISISDVDKHDPKK